MDEETFSHLVEVIHEQLHDETIASVDPFDLYVARLRTSVYTDKKIERKLAEGYEVLFQQVTKKT